MPWENSKVNDQQAAWPGSRLMPKSKLAVPGGGASQDRSRSTTPGILFQVFHEQHVQLLRLMKCPELNFDIETRRVGVNCYFYIPKRLRNY